MRINLFRQHMSAALRLPSDRIPGALETLSLPPAVMDFPASSAASWWSRAKTAAAIDDARRAHRQHQPHARREHHHNEDPIEYIHNIPIKSIISRSARGPGHRKLPQRLCVRRAARVIPGHHPHGDV